MKNLLLVLLSATLLVFADDNKDNNNNNDDDDNNYKANKAKYSDDLRDKVDHGDPKAAQTAKIEVIVRYKKAPSKDELSQLGPYGQIKHMYGAIKGIHVALTAQTIKHISTDPNIAYVTPNRKTKGAVDISTGTVGANLVWSYGYDGTGIGVAVIDSGITVRNDFKSAGASRVVYSESFVPGDSDPSDAFGHGTHVAGIIGGNGASSAGSAFTRHFQGVAPNVSLVNLRVLDQNGGAVESDVIAAIQRAIDLKSTYNIRVINLSLGHRVYESYTLDPLCQAVEAAWQAGIAVVVAAGNYGRDNVWGTKGYGTIASPGNDPYVITVGATNAKGTITEADDSIATYSSKGPTLVDHIAKPDLVAPGNNVTSVLASPNCTLATAFPATLVSDASYQPGTSGKSGDYFKLSGTSMATPVVSGAAALLLQKDPTLTPDQLKARLMKTARKILPSYMSGRDSISNVTYMNQADVFTVGAGYLDIFAALQNNDRVTMPANSPTVVFNSASHKVTLFRNMNIIWGDNIVWGDNTVWGTSLFDGTSQDGFNIVWGDAMVWGDPSSGGFNIIWGDSIYSYADLAASDADDGDTDS